MDRLDAHPESEKKRQDRIDPFEAQNNRRTNRDEQYFTCCTHALMGDPFMKKHFPRPPSGPVWNATMVEETLVQSEMIISTFKLARWKFEVALPKEKIPRESLNLLTAVTVRPDCGIKVSGTVYPIIVFSARLNAELKFEQVAEGFPCRNESEAATIAQAIQSKNRKTPSVGLASWAGHFTLATISNYDYFREELVLFKFRKPKIVKQRRCGYALRIYQHFVDKPRQMIWEEVLHTTDIRTAKKLMRNKDAELAKRDAEKRAKLDNAPAQSDADLTAIQLKVLSKAYPKTVAYLSNPDSKNADAAFTAYKQETLAVTGHLVDALTKPEFKNVARLLEKASRRKNPPLNEVEFQLVVGWRLHGYNHMTPSQRFQKLKELGLTPASPEAVRKTCERLNLPRPRKRGAPRKTPTAK